MQATLSVLGMLNYDSTVLDGLYAQIPAALEQETLEYTIKMECAELELTITEPTLFKNLVAAWAKRNRLPWQRYYNAVVAEYNPLDNYDRTETETIGEDGSDTRETGTTSSTTSDTTRTPNLTTEDQVSGFNSANYAPKSKTMETGTDRNAGSTTGSADTDTSGSYEREISRTTRAHGNIGVTTSQQMLTQELEITVRLDVYQHITDDFKKTFCLLVY